MGYWAPSAPLPLYCTQCGRTAETCACRPKAIAGVDLHEIPIDVLRERCIDVANECSDWEKEYSCRKKTLGSSILTDIAAYRVVLRRREHDKLLTELERRGQDGAGHET